MPVCALRLELRGLQGSRARLPGAPPSQRLKQGLGTQGSFSEKEGRGPRDLSAQGWVRLPKEQSEGLVAGGRG